MLLDLLLITVYSTGMKYLIANWKAQMTFPQVREWIAVFEDLIREDSDISYNLTTNNLAIIICPPSPFILYLQDQILGIPNLYIGAQDISHVEEGKYTGEVTTKALQGLISHSILGHSERRSEFGETEENIAKKITLCKKYAVEPILCVRDEKDTIFDGVKLVAYEPVSAIGTGQNMNPAEVVEIKKKFSLPAEVTFIYGGSADEKNCKEYIATGEIDGFLVGTASLEPQRFFNMAKTL